MSRHTSGLHPILAAPLLLAGCSGLQSALEPHGAAAREIADLWWLMFALGAAVYVVVAAVLLAAGLRRRPERDADAREVEGSSWIVVGGVVVPLVILVAVFVFTLRSLGALAPSRHRSDLTIEVTGQQWWWELRYQQRGAPAVISANEIHLPVGRPVRVILGSIDVIHSFWVPSLQGKTDLVPGRSNTTWLQADRAGVFRGQCAEYCGRQHARMGLLVVAESPGDFAAWLERERQDAVGASEPAARRGQEVFLRSGCAFCHTIRGTEASGRVGPDLTHIASRRTLAAGTLPNTPGHLAGWIAAPQAFKPGSAMPQIPLDGPAIQALLAYLGSLR